MSMIRGTLRLGTAAVLATVVCGHAGVAMQHVGAGGGITSAPSPSMSQTQNSPATSNGLDPIGPRLPSSMEEQRRNAVNLERQRAMTHDAELLLQTAAELQIRVLKNEPGTTQEAMRQVEAIEKLARSVKDKMKGKP